MSAFPEGAPHLVYSWPGPPSLELWVETVERNGRRWNQHRLVADGGVPGVIVVASRSGSFAMVEHFRPTVGRSFLEFPRGFGTKAAGSGTAHALQDAERELREETGYQGVDFRVVGRVWADTSLLQGSATVISARIEAEGAQSPSDGEADRVRWLPVDRFPTLVEGGEIADALTMSAYLQWLAAQ